jgi:AhpD family alkylhydroperoxidase
VPAPTLALVHLRASQINGCSSCVESGSRNAKKAGESDQRLFAVAAWRDSPHVFNRLNIATRQVAGAWG